MVSASALNFSPHCPTKLDLSDVDELADRTPAKLPGGGIVAPLLLVSPCKPAGGTMYFEQFYLGCLAHASYLLASEGEAVVVDPQRDVDLYLKAAATQGVAIRHIFETHLHADFVSGHKELAARTGATIYIGARAGAQFPHVPVADGFELNVGTLRIRVLETPGHTPESICLVIVDKEKSPDPWAVLTGDTLFLGDVGRPDLSREYTPAQLAGMLYDSLNNKLLPLADGVLVYPAHGAGSLCGKNMRAERSSTIGTERLTNYALQIRSKNEFVAQLTEHLPARPEYFSQDAEINRAGAAALSDLPELRRLAPAELDRMLREDEIALDVRSCDEFAAGHVPGSANIALSGQFASWAGTVLGLKAHPVLIADSDEQLSEARVRLARVGIEDLDGYLDGGVGAWKAAGFALATLPQISPDELSRQLDGQRLQVLDVRREPEWEAGHIEGAAWWPLDNFKISPPEIDRQAPIAVHCKSGYRSSIACSLLLRAGFKNITNVSGGFDAWQQAKLPFVSAKPVGA
jgi:hydroxyacylglutathione hydrolase